MIGRVISVNSSRSFSDQLVKLSNPKDDQKLASAEAIPGGLAVERLKPGRVLSIYCDR